LNEIVALTGTGTTIRRVASGQNNYAWNGMTLTYTNSAVTIDPTLNGKDGATIMASQAKTQTTWTDASRWYAGDGGGWNFNSVWQWNGENGMPSLRDVGTVPEWPTYLKDDDFIVATKEDLYKVGRGNASTPGYEKWTLYRHYRQIADIEFDSSDPNWTPIGDNTTNNRFTGNYDGGGHTITGLTIDITSSYQGMFGYISGVGKVENLGLIGVDISGGEGTGGIAGDNEGTIQNCYVTGSVRGTTVVGGIAGYAGYDNGARTIQNCYFIGSVTGTGNNVGGIAGYITGFGYIQNSYATGSVTGNGYYVGGILGNENGFLQNCVALNESVTSSTSTPGRISRSTSSLYNNYAWSDMSVNGSPVTNNIGLTTGNGADITTAEARTETKWTDSGRWSNYGSEYGRGNAWNFNTVWKWNGEDGMPSLRVFGDDVPLPQWPDYFPFIANTISDFKAWLDSQPQNDITTAYSVKLNVSDLGGDYGYPGSVANALYTNSARYVSLDLSGSTFTSIDYYTFAYCNNLTGITIPASVTNIGQEAFRSCGLTGITIPASVTNIGEEAFRDCGFTDITIPASVTNIDVEAFRGCTGLISVTFAAGSDIDGADFSDYVFPEGSEGYVGNSLKEAYLQPAPAGGAGTYTRAAGGSTWTKQ